MHLSAWVDEATWQEVHGTLAGFDARSSWDGLLATARLFRRLARETATAAGLMYPAAVDDAVWQYVATFRERLAPADG